MHAYLVDRYEYAQESTEAAPASVAAYEGAASRIAGECSGVLIGAPQGTGIEVGSDISSRTGRQRGEERRQKTQLSDLEEELSSELLLAEWEPRRPAVMALVAKLKALSQGDPTLSYVADAETITLEEDLQAESTDVCADMRAWVGSGYRTLSLASRVIALKEEADFAKVLRDVSALSAGGYASAEESLFATETSADKVLVRETTQLELQLEEASRNSIDSARGRVEAALGLTARQKREKAFESTSHEIKSSTEIGAGHTAAGTKFTVWLERKKGGSPDRCKLSVEVKTQVMGLTVMQIITSGESEGCLAPRKDRSEAPSVRCGEGLLTIKAEVLSATRTVDLRMSNGKQIASRPVLVPRRLGGPDAFYYQAVRGPFPIPVSLTERDASGRTLRVLGLRRIVGCSKHPLKYLPGGKRTLVSGQVSQGGQHYSIVGERYRLFGRIHTQLKLRTGEGLVSSGEGEEEGPIEGPSGSFAVSVKRTKPLESEVSAGCHPHEYSVFYGLLKHPRDTVLAKVEGKLMPLRRVHIPASIHAGGVLVYLVSAGRPEEIVVRAPSGKTVMSENHVVRAHEGRETCEGESEGASGPPPGDLGGLSDETSRIMLTG